MKALLGSLVRRFGMFRDSVYSRQINDLNRTLESVIRDGVFPELARLMLASGKPWNHEVFAAVKISPRRVFPQKRSQLLRFYRRAFLLLDRPPACILEIGVKWGLSLQLWKQIFPDAKVIGADIETLKLTPPDGITLLHADQGKPETIAALGAQFGPFDLVIDDGSHIGEHMVNSLSALLPHLNAGALYVMEDILGRGSGKEGFADDGKIGELVTAALSYFAPHAKPWVPPESSIQEQARCIFPRMQTLLLDKSVLAFIVRSDGR